VPGFLAFLAQTARAKLFVRTGSLLEHAQQLSGRREHKANTLIVVSVAEPGAMRQAWGCRCGHEVLHPKLYGRPVASEILAHGQGGAFSPGTLLAR